MRKTVEILDVKIDVTSKAYYDMLITLQQNINYYRVVSKNSKDYLIVYSKIESLLTFLCDKCIICNSEILEIRRRFYNLR